MLTNRVWGGGVGGEDGEAPYEALVWGEGYPTQVKV